jgi:hypothetical protein
LNFFFRSLPAVRKSISEKRVGFLDIRLRCSTKLNSFSISLRRLSIFIEHAARMNSKCQLSAHKKRVSILVPFFLLFSKIYWISLSLSAREPFSFPCLGYAKPSDFHFYRFFVQFSNIITFLCRAR